MARLLITTGDSLVRLEEASGGWRQELQLEGSGAQCLAVDPADRERVYVGCRQGGAHASADGGASFRALELPERDVFSLAVSPADGAVYAGTEPSRLFRSDDRGESWRELTALQEIPSRPRWSFPPRPWTSHVRTIAPDPHRAERVLVGIELGGVMRTEDAGASFSDHAPGAQRDVHALAWHPAADGRVYEAAGGGAAWSRDGGARWGAADAGRDRHYCWALAVDPDDPERWFTSAAPGPFHAHGSRDAEARLYRWDGDGPWRRLGGGLPDPLDSMPYALGFADGRLFVALRDGRLFASLDRGESFSELPIAAPTVAAMEVVPG